MEGIKERSMAEVRSALVEPEPAARSWRFSRIVVNSAEALVAIAVTVELVVLFGNMATRSLLGFSLIWSQEVALLCLSVIAFVGGALAYPRKLHSAVEIGVRIAPQRIQAYLHTLAELLVLATGVAIVLFSIPTLFVEQSQVSPILHLSELWFGLPIPLGMTLLCYFALERLSRRAWRHIIGSGVSLAFLLGLLWYTQPLWENSLGPTSSLWFSLLGLGLILYIGVPIGFVLALTSVLYLYLSGAGSVTSIPLGMQSGVSDFVLLAIPFFIVAGLVMTNAGLTTILVRWIETFTGHLRGGLFYVTILTMYVFSGISGSKAADVAAVGTTMRDMFSDAGYNREEGVAVLSGATVMGETIPPSLPMLVLGSVTTLSIGTLFIAGLLPAVLIGAFLMALVFFRSRKQKMPVTARSTWPMRARSTVTALPVLMIPIILIGGIVSGLTTPTEASSIAVIYALLVGVLHRPRLGVSALRRIAVESSALSGMVLFIVSTAVPFSRALTVGGIPQDIAAAIASLGGHAWLFLLVSIVALIVMGELLEGLPAVLIFAPLLVPMAPMFGINPLHYAIVILFAMGIGSFAPPIGIGLYIACTVSGTTMERSVRRLLPYLAILVVGLIVLAFVPEVTLALPHLLHRL